MKKIMSLCMLVLLTACSTLKIHTPEADSYFPDIEKGKKQYDVVLVLGGGGVRGLAHLGVLEELERAGIEPDLIVGCSAGAIVGALYADYPHAETLKKILFQATKDDFMTSGIFPVSRFALASGYPLQNYLMKHLHVKRFRGLMIPLVVTATDLGSGKLIEIHQGNIATAVHASAAFPGVFEPVVIQGKYLVDGGVIDNLPVKTAKKFNPKLIIAVEIGEGLTKSEPTNMLGILKRSIEISYYNKSQQVAEDADVLIKMNFQNIGLFDDSKKHEIYEEGRRQARAALSDLKDRLKAR